MLQRLVMTATTSLGMGETFSDRWRLDGGDGRRQAGLQAHAQIFEEMVKLFSQKQTTEMMATQVMEMAEVLHEQLKRDGSAQTTTLLPVSDPSQ